MAEKQDVRIEIAVHAHTAMEMIVILRLLLTTMVELDKQEQATGTNGGWIRRVASEGERRLSVLQSNLDQVRMILDPDKKGERDESTVQS